MDAIALWSDRGAHGRRSRHWHDTSGRTNGNRDLAALRQRTVPRGLRLRNEDIDRTGLGCTSPWILAVVDRSPSGDSDDPHAIPDAYRGTAGRPGPVLFTLDVDGKRFAIRQAGDGGTNYDWLSGPNKGYGFASSGTPNRSVEEHRESIRVFLAMIDPNTGYIGDD